MRQFLFFILNANLLFSCQLKSQESISANKSTSEKTEKPSQLAQRVSALKKESGVLGCAGVKSAMNLFVRTRAAFVDGEGGPALNAFLTYREPSTGLDLSDVFMACTTFPYKK